MTRSVNPVGSVDSDAGGTVAPRRYHAPSEEPAFGRRWGVFCAGISSVGYDALAESEGDLGLAVVGGAE
jgi:hypothetical protein